MKKKKKIKLSNLEDFLFDSYNNIIEINNKNNIILNNIKQIKQQLDTSLFVHYGIKDTCDNNNIDFMCDFTNIDYAYYKFNKNDKIICSNISKYSNVYKNILIPNFNNKKNIHKQLDYFNAEATYQSIIANATFEDLKKEAQDKLTQVTADKAKK